MEITSKFIDSINAIITAHIDANSIKEKLNQVAQKTAKHVKIDGFRPGKVPVNVVLNRYEKELKADAKQEILKDIIDKSLVELDRKSSQILGDPMFLKFEEKDDNIDTEIEISFRPVVDLGDYKSLIPNFELPKVTKEEVDEKIKEILKMITQPTKVEKEVLENGDFAKFDFEGFIDGQSFENGKAENYVLEIGSKQFIPGFEDGMIGLKIGEEKDISVKFPDDYQEKKLAGKDAVFKVKLHEIQGKNIPAELGEKELKILMPNEEASKEKFEERLKSQIENEKFQTLLNDELKPKFAEILIEKYNFDLPKVIVEQEIDMQFRNALNSFTKEEIEKYQKDVEALKEKKESFRKDAENSVKLTFIIDEMAKKENIVVSDQELTREIYLEAYRYGVDPKVHFEDYQNRGILPALKMALIEEKLFHKIFNKKETK